MKLLKSLITASTLAVASTAMAMSSSPEVVTQELLDSWEFKAVKLQNQIDRNAPFSTNNTLGSHNTYNSEEYANDGYIRYVDPQQKHTINEQLRMGARFIELDVHWAVNSSNFRYHLMLCHATCSLNDRYLNEGLDEVRAWLDSPESEDQVLILYIEDHSDNVHDQMYSQLNNKIGQYVYKSHGCKSTPSTLTKADVLANGKKVVIWKDGRDEGKLCSDNNGLKNMVFTGLDGLSRVWEDRTFFGSTFDGSKEDIYSGDLINYFKNGQNLVNLDDFTYNDGRTNASIWSWDVNEPNNWNGNQDCAVQWANGRWDDADCGDAHAFACNEVGTNNWQVTGYGAWSNGLAACAALSGNYQFSAPTNAKDNQALKNAKGNTSHVWLNYNDRGQEGQWVGASFDYRELRDNRANLCIDIPGTPTNGLNVKLYGCWSGWQANNQAAQHQQWIYEQSTGLIRSAKNNAMCLDMENGPHSGRKLQVWSCDAGHVNQTWDLLGNTIRPRANHNLAIDAFGSERASEVGLWSVHGGDNQSWTWGAK